MRYRFLTRPAWLAAIAGLLLLAALFVRLGVWQFDRAHRTQKISAADLAARSQPTPLAELLTSGVPSNDAAIGRTVEMSGSYDGQRQLLVPDRTLAGKTGYYVIAPFKLADGSVVVVNRGWSASPAAPAVSPGTVTVRGWLAYTESSDSASAAALSDAAQDSAHRIAAIDVAALVNQWPYQLDRAYVTALSQDPADSSGLGAVPAPAPPSGKTDWNILNLGYTLQWWLFSVVAFWWFASYVRRRAVDMAAELDGEADHDADADDEDGGDGGADSADENAGADALDDAAENSASVTPA
jgi:cytochrome oxidase assembly protein ShyY1